MKKWITRLIVVAVLVAGGWVGLNLIGQDEQYMVRTTGIAQGPLAMTVTATGHLAPTTEVMVGCEVSGTVETVLAQAAMLLCL